MADVEWSDDEEEEPAYAQGLTKITALWQPKPKAVAKDGRPVSLFPPEAHFSQVHVDEKESPRQNSQGVDRNRTHARPPWSAPSPISTSATCTLHPAPHRPRRPGWAHSRSATCSSLRASEGRSSG